jgi:hypothetical protein
MKKCLFYLECKSKEIVHWYPFKKTIHSRLKYLTNECIILGKPSTAFKQNNSVSEEVPSCCSCEVAGNLYQTAKFSSLQPVLTKVRVVNIV